jgi:hypothetical protein
MDDFKYRLDVGADRVDFIDPFLFKISEETS